MYVDPPSGAGTCRLELDLTDFENFDCWPEVRVSDVENTILRAFPGLFPRGSRSLWHIQALRVAGTHFTSVPSPMMGTRLPKQRERKTVVRAGSRPRRMERHHEPRRRAQGNLKGMENQASQMTCTQVGYLACVITLLPRPQYDECYVVLWSSGVPTFVRVTRQEL